MTGVSDFFFFVSFLNTQNATLLTFISWTQSYSHDSIAGPHQMSKIALFIVFILIIP